MTATEQMGSHHCACWPRAPGKYRRAISVILSGVFIYCQSPSYQGQSSISILPQHGFTSSLKSFALACQKSHIKCQVVTRLNKCRVMTHPDMKHWSSPYERHNRNLSFRGNTFKNNVYWKKMGNDRSDYCREQKQRVSILWGFFLY